MQIAKLDFSFTRWISGRDLIVVLAIALTLTWQSHAAEQDTNTPVLIATSQSPLATAYNNGRRLVRDDCDRRYVVYQDEHQGVPIVCLVRSDNGITWSKPDTLTPGAFPAIAIDRNNRLYLVWQAPDQGGIFFSFSLDAGQSWQPPQQLSAQKAEETQYPVVEAGQARVHVAWQQLTNWGGSAIAHTSLHLDSLSSPFSAAIIISSEPTPSRMPAIAANLDYDPGALHIVWSDSADQNGTPIYTIRYRKFDEESENWVPDLSDSSWLLSDWSNSPLNYPAISVGSGELNHAVWSQGASGGFHSCLFAYYPPGFRIFSTDDIATFGSPFICVDDILMKFSALVWVDNGDVFYMQALDGRLISPDYIPVSAALTAPNAYPSVGYKHFRADSLDVIWTAGARSPYSLFYRRMKKIYFFEPVAQPRGPLPRSPLLLTNYPNPFNASTVIQFDLPRSGFCTLAIFNLRAQRVRTLARGHLSAGSHHLTWDGRDDAGNPLPTAVYLARLESDSGIRTNKLLLLK